MDVKSTLESVGLSGNEVKVYLALLDLGSALAGEITKKSGVNRTNVYDALNRLTDRGLVSYVIQSNRKYFEATPPGSLVNYLDEKEHEIKTKKLLIASLLPGLEQRRKLSREPQESTIYKGRKGLRSVAEDVLSTGRPMFAFGAEGKFVELFTHYAEQWHMRRGKLGISLKIIFNEKLRKAKANADFPRAQIRFNTHVYDTPATTWIFGDKVAIIVWSEQPLITLIRSKAVARSYLQFFDIMWNDSRP